MASWSYLLCAFTKIFVYPIYANVLESLPIHVLTYSMQLPQAQEILDLQSSPLQHQLRLA